MGASLLAKNANDNAGILYLHGALEFFVGTPPGAGSLLNIFDQHYAQRRRSTPITTSATTTNPSSIPPALMNTWR